MFFITETELTELFRSGFGSVQKRIRFGSVRFIKKNRISIFGSVRFWTEPAEFSALVAVIFTIFEQ